VRRDVNKGTADVNKQLSDERKLAELQAKVHGCGCGCGRVGVGVGVGVGEWVQALHFKGGRWV